MAKQLPEVYFFAGPNGSGKSTATKGFGVKGEYINADDIKRSTGCDDLTAARQAEQRRINAVESKTDFTFETVLSTDRNLQLLKRAKDAGYFVRGIYVITVNPLINVARVKTRVMNGEHDVPSDKITSRYKKSLALIPAVLQVCDICNIYDNSGKEPFRIFKKHKDHYYYCETSLWGKEKISELTGIPTTSLLPLSQLHQV